ncbi:MAG: cobalamin-dependent protein [Pseudomonadota bacterium]
MQELVNAMVDMQENRVMELTKQYLGEGKEGIEILKAYQEAMSIVGKRFEEQSYFIPELIMSGEMMKKGAEIIKPFMDNRESVDTKKKCGKFLLATVKGDIHDIGKNIVAMMMNLSGFEVLDLGVDVPEEKIFVEAQAFGADIIGLSGLLTLAFDPMKRVVDMLKEKGVRDNYKVIIGGAQLDRLVCDSVGADAFATDVISGVNQCKEWTGIN